MHSFSPHSLSFSFSVAVSTASPVSDLGSPAHGAFQQFPTDLSLKTTTTSSSSVIPLPHHTPVRSSSASPHRSSHPPPQFPPSKQERSSHSAHGAPEYRQGSRSRSGSGSPQRESSSPPAGGHPPLLKPCKRPSDFSTAFLLSHHSTPKRSYSPPPTAPPPAAPPLGWESDPRWGGLLKVGELSPPVCQEACTRFV